MLVDGIRQLSGIDLAVWWGSADGLTPLHDGSPPNEQVASALAMAVVVPFNQRGPRFTDAINHWVMNVAQPLMEHTNDFRWIWD